MKRPTSIAFFGGFPLGRGTDGVYTVQKFFADFVLGFKEQYERIVVFGLVLPETKQFSGHLVAPNLEIVPLQAGLRNRLQTWRKIWQALPVDVFWGHMPNMLVLYPLVPFVRQRVGKFLVYNGNDFERFIRESNYGQNRFYHRYGLWAYRDSLKRADTVIARGKRLSRQAAELNPNVVETIPLANLIFSEQGPLDRQPYGPNEIVYAGQMLWSKGLKELLVSFDNLTAAYPDKSFRLHLLGSGEDFDEIQRFAQNLPCADQLIFYGWLDDPDSLSQIWSQASMVVMPTTTYPEGVPRVIEEGICRRMPVVATKVSGVPEEFADGEVLLVEPGNVPQLQSAMEKGLFDPETRSGLATALQGRLAHLSRHESAAKQHLSVIQGLYNGDAS